MDGRMDAPPIPQLFVWQALPAILPGGVACTLQWPVLPIAALMKVMIRTQGGRGEPPGRGFLST
eukprot:12887501-Prorocentrum_lima.AAC.1